MRNRIAKRRLRPFVCLSVTTYMYIHVCLFISYAAGTTWLFSRKMPSSITTIEKLSIAYYFRQSYHMSKHRFCGIFNYSDHNRYMYVLSAFSRSVTKMWNVNPFITCTNSLFNGNFMRLNLFEKNNEIWMKLLIVSFVSFIVFVWLKSEQE